jgi:hypothetical protein
MELIKSSAYQVRSITSNDSSVVVGDRRSRDWIWSKSTRDRMVGEWRDLGLVKSKWCVQMGFSGKRVWIQLDRACTRQ